MPIAVTAAYVRELAAEAVRVGVAADGTPLLRGTALLAHAGRIRACDIRSEKAMCI